VTGWPIPAPPAHWGSPGQPAFVGRRSERRLLENAWADTQRGIRRFVLVCGEAGAGKTRLVTDTANVLFRSGAAVLGGGCSADFGQPYDPLAEPVRVLLPWTASGQIKVGDEVATQDEVVDRLRRVVGSESSVAVSSTRLLFDAVSRLVAAAAVPHPLVLVLEDLHWAAETGARLVVHLAEALTDVPLLILGTLRSSGSTTDSSPTLAALYRLAGVDRVDLHPLDTDDIADYLHRGHGVTQAAAVALAPDLRDQTGGNPFLLREVCRSWPKGGVPASAAQAPASVRASVLASCAGLSATSLEVLRLSAVLGQQVSATELGWCLAESGATDDRPAEQFVGARVLAGIDDAIGAGLLERVTAHDGAYRFIHALTRQSVLAGVTELDLARLYARVAVALERRLPAGPMAAFRLAHYYLAATSLGYTSPAIRHLRAAAANAESQSAFADAGALYERAAGLTTGTERDGLRLDAARCHSRAGKFARSREISEVLARGTGDTELAVRAATMYEEAAWQSGEPGQSSAVLLTRALSAGSEVAEIPRVLAIASLARAHAYAGDPAAAARYIEQALASARQLGERHILAEVLERSVQLDLRPSALERRLALTEELVALLPDKAELATRGGAAARRCADAYISGDLARLKAARSDMAEVARVTGEPVWAWTLSMQFFARDLVVGDLAAAAAAAEYSHEYAGSFEDADRSSGVWGLQMYLVQRELGALEAARPILADYGKSAGFWLPATMALATELGMTDLTARLFDRILGDDPERAEQSSTWPAVLAFLGDAVALLGDPGRARLLLPRARAYAGLNLLGAEFVAPLGSAERTIAQIESVLSLDSAADHYASALEMDRQMEAPLHEATTLAEYAAHLRRRGAPAAEIDAVADGVRGVARSRGWLRVLRLAGADGGPPPREGHVAAPRASKASPPGSDRVDRPLAVITSPPTLVDPLTRRELEVLRLLVQGLRNRDIAASLVISDYTAANHVRSILMKTGSANRTQAARFAAVHGLLDEAGSGP
jgi:DNA-binding CsgD family transcriptional regulator